MCPMQWNLKKQYASCPAYYTAQDLLWTKNNMKIMSAIDSAISKVNTEDLLVWCHT